MDQSGPKLSMAPSRSEGPAYLPQLDGLRGLAVLLVLLAHLPYAYDVKLTYYPWKLVQILKTGYIGVDLFFVLSGFLITRLLLDERRKMSRIRFRPFYARRAIRIFPIYFFCVAVVSILSPASPGLTASLFGYAFNYYAPFHPMPYPLEHTWSLAVEEQFYLFWPVALAVLPLAWLSRTTSVLVPVAALAAGLLFSVLLAPALAAQLIYMSLSTRILSLSLGAYLAVRESEARPVPARAAALCLLAGAATLALAAVARAGGMLPAGGYYWCLALAGYGLLAFGTVGFVAAADGWRSVRWTLCRRPLRYLGRISYGVYLYHLPVLYCLHLNQAALGYGPVAARQLLLSLSLILGLSMASYTLIEQPLLRRKAWLSRLLGGEVPLVPLRPSASRA